MHHLTQLMRWQVARIIAAVIVVVACFVGASAAAEAWFDTQAATDRAVASLQSTNDELDSTRELLDAADAALADAEATLAGDVETLGLREDERVAAQAVFDDASALLAQLQSELESSFTDLANKSARHDALVSCLSGATQALNQASVGDVFGMTATFDRIEGSCAEAGATL